MKMVIYASPAQPFDPVDIDLLGYRIDAPAHTHSCKWMAFRWQSKQDRMYAIRFELDDSISEAKSPPDGY